MNELSQQRPNVPESRLGFYKAPALTLLIAASLFFLLPGCERMTDSGKIVGKWSWLRGVRKFEFKSDGTFVDMAPLGSYEGKYRFENGRLKMDTHSNLWGTHTMNYKYSFEGAKLFLTDGLEDVPFKEIECTRIP